MAHSPLTPHPSPNRTAPHTRGATPGVCENSVTDGLNPVQNACSDSDHSALGEYANPGNAIGDCDHAETDKQRIAHGEPPPASPAARAGASTGAGGGGVSDAGERLVGVAGVGALDVAGTGAGAGVAHTPGPWVAESGVLDDQTDRGLAVIAVLPECQRNGNETPTRGMVAWISSGMGACDTDEQAIATARLIAAAPDVTAALREWLGLFERGNLPLTIGVQHCIDVTRAALAKVAA